MTTPNKAQHTPGRGGAVSNYILQPNGEITAGDGRHILDSFTAKHLMLWIGNQFSHTGQEGEKWETILNFLSAQDTTDIEYWLGRTWWEVLTNAEYAIDRAEGRAE